MTPSILNEVFLPLGLAFIMFGMGLSLTKNDFVQLFKIPKPIIIGLVGQVVLLPILAFVIALSFSLSAPLAIGLMILSACPGGTTSNMFSHLARANVALSIALTTFCTLLCVITTPLLIQLSIEYFASQQAPDFSIAKTSLGLFIITLIPVALGLSIRHYFASVALKSETFFRRFSVIFMVLIIILLVVKEHELIFVSFQQVFMASFTLNLLSCLLGLVMGTLFSLSHKDSLTLGIEIGIQNATMAMLIAISFLGAPDYAITAGVYGIVMYLIPTIMIVSLKYFRSSKHNKSVVNSGVIENS
jgi:bile acid:Na+ symporter, BASS family